MHCLKEPKCCLLLSSCSSVGSKHGRDTTQRHNDPTSPTSVSLCSPCYTSLVPPLKRHSTHGPFENLEINLGGGVSKHTMIARSVYLGDEQRLLALSASSQSEAPRGSPGEVHLHQPPASVLPGPLGQLAGPCVQRAPLLHIIHIGSTASGLHAVGGIKKRKKNEQKCVVIKMSMFMSNQARLWC